MKLTIQNNQVVIIAENPSDSTNLLGFYYEQEKVPVVHKQHKKHNFFKECPECGEKFKGLNGLGIHRSWKHGFHSVKTVKNFD
jgi:hypothetical protein